MFGFLPLTLAFAVVQMLFLSKHIDLEIVENRVKDRGEDRVEGKPRADTGE